MNANRVIQIFFGDAFQNGHSEPLSDFTCVGPKEVESYDLSIFSIVDDNFCISILGPVVVQIPLQRFVDTAIGHDILISEFLASLFFAVAAAAVLNRGEDSGGDIFVIHYPSASSE